MQYRIALVLGLVQLCGIGIVAAADNHEDLAGRLARLAANPPAENAWISEWERTASAYQLAVIDPGFDAIPAARQLEALRAAAYHAYRARRFGTAWELAAQASDRPESDGQDLLLRLHAAVAIRSWNDAANTLDVLVGRFPGSLPKLNPDYFSELMRAIKRGSEERYFRVAQQLFDAGYRYYGVMEPDAQWRDLALHLLEQDEPEAARRVAARILHVRVLIDFRAERRTEGLLDGHAYRNRFRDALRTQLEQARRLVAEHPNDTVPFSYYTELLSLGGLNSETLQSTSALLKQREEGDPKRPAFDDGSSAQWIHNERANALWRLRRKQEALDEMQRGSAMLEHGEINTSQNLNLANLQCIAGKPEDARITLQRTGTMSPYGKMVYWQVALCAARGLKDAKGATQALDYLRSHSKDSVSGLIDALISTGNLEEAATHLVASLQDDETRSSMLSELQQIEPARLPTENDRLEAKRWNELLSKADVKAVIEDVGHVHHYDLRL